MNYSQIIENIYYSVLKGDNLGKIPTYIPELSQISDEKFGVYFCSLNKKSFGIGDFDEKFSIQSIAKVISMSLA